MLVLVYEGPGAVVVPVLLDEVRRPMSAEAVVLDRAGDVTERRPDTVARVGVELLQEGAELRVSVPPTSVVLLRM